MSLMDLLVWLTGAGSLMAISWAAEYFNWFVGMEPKQKKLVFFGIAAGITIASMLAINFVPEEVIKISGKKCIEMGQLEEAIIVYSYGVNKYYSSNLFERLAEAYLKNGQKELAIKNYKKSLELNPGNEDAKKMLDKLKN